MSTDSVRGHCNFLQHAFPTSSDETQPNFFEHNNRHKTGKGCIIMKNGSCVLANMSTFSGESSEKVMGFLEC